MASSATNVRMTGTLRVSSYDRVASLLIALLILVGTVVLILFAIWLTSRVFLHQEAVPVELVTVGEGDGLDAGGMNLDQPTEEEIGLETDLETPAVEQTLATIADAVGNQMALLQDPTLTDQALSGKGGGSQGDGRMVGRGTGSGSGVPRNWELRFEEGNTLQSYAKQLDFFKIELGVLAPGNQVVYAYNLSKATPDTRTGTADQEKRYYLTWRGGALQEADRDLLTKAGVDSSGRLILKFLPPEVEGALVALEKGYANREPEEIRKTRFGIRSQGSGYAFFVMEQWLR